MSRSSEPSPDDEDWSSITDLGKGWDWITTPHGSVIASVTGDPLIVLQNMN